MISRDMDALVSRKEEFIGGTLSETDLGMTAETEILNLSVRKDKRWEGVAVLSVRGKKFSCQYAISHVSWYEGPNGTVVIRGYMGGCTIIPRKEAAE